MTNWRQSLLKEVVLLWVKGATPKRSEKSYFSSTEGIPWVRVSDLNKELITETQQYLTPEGAEQAGRAVPKNAVLLSVSGTIGKTAIAGVQLMVNQAVQAMVFDESQVLPEYAYYYFQFFRPWFETAANTVTIPNLTKAQLENTVILYPDIREQKDIIRLLAQAKKIVERQQQTGTDLNAVLFHAMHGKWMETWQRLPRVSLSEILTEPLLLGLSSPKEGSVPVRFVNTIVPGVWGMRENTACLAVSVGEEEALRCQLKQGDILLRRYRTDEDEPGMLIEENLPGTVWGAGLFRIRVRRDRIRPEFLLLWLRYSFRYLGNEPYFEKTLADAGTVGNIQIPLVPVKEQDRLVRMVRRALSLQRTVQGMEEKAQQYYRAMLVSAFTGRLTRNYRGEHGLEAAERSFFQDAYRIRYVDYYDGMAHGAVDLEQFFDGGEQELLGYLSEFQRQVLQIYAEAHESLPVHTMFKRLRKSKGRRFRTQSIQDAVAAVRILEGLGFLRQDVPEKLMMDGVELTDSGRKPITIQKYEICGGRRDADEIGVSGD